MVYDAFSHLPIYRLEDLGFLPRGEGGAFIALRNTAPRRQIAFQHQWRRPLLHAFRHVRHVRLAGERAPDARHRPRPNLRRPDLGLPRRRRHVRRLRHDHHVERAALSGVCKRNLRCWHSPPTNSVISPLTALLETLFLGHVVRGDNGPKVEARTISIAANGGTVGRALPGEP